MVEVVRNAKSPGPDMKEKTDVILHASHSRNEFQLSPGFALFTFLFLFFSSGLMFIASGKNHGLEEFAVPFALFFTPIFLFGLWFFQHSEFTLTAHNVLWSSTIIPWIWVEKWEEPLSKYREIAIEYTIPLFLLRNRFWFHSSHASHPSRIILRSSAPMARIFNQTRFAVFVLIHASDPSKNISFHRLESHQAFLIRAFAEKMSEKLRLPIRNLETHNLPPS